MGLYKRLEPNNQGRDFVVGDIHGSYQMLDLALAQVNFNTANDRLISVGDLVDRGPESLRCLEFLRQPWFFAVRGNHEDVLIDIFSTGKCDLRALAGHIPNGVAWAAQTPLETMLEIVAKFRTLPVVMDLTTERGTVGFVHADIPAGMNWNDFTARIEAEDYKTIQTALWGRKRIYDENEDGVLGIGRIFVGHTPVEGATRLGNIYYVDTGAVFYELNPQNGGGLTMARLNTATQSFHSEPMQAPIEIKDSPAVPSDRPFGNYAKIQPTYTS